MKKSICLFNIKKASNCSLFNGPSQIELFFFGEWKLYKSHIHYIPKQFLQYIHTLIEITIQTSNQYKKSIKKKLNTTTNCKNCRHVISYRFVHFNNS